MEASRLLAAFIVCDVTVRLCFIEPAMASCGVRVKWSDGETNSVQLRELFKQLLCIPNFLNPPQHFGPGQQTQSNFYLSICKLYLETVETNLITIQKFEYRIVSQENPIKLQFR